MNYANLQQTEITLNGKGEVNLHTTTPNCLIQGLIPKRVAVQNFYLTTRSIPKFIPQLVTEASLAYHGGAVPYSGNSTNTSLIQYTQTDYFVNCRNVTNSVCFTAFAYWTNPNNLPSPFGQYNQIDVERSPYYYSYNVMDFVTMVQVAMNAALHGALGAAPTSPCAFTYDAETDTFNFSTPSTYQSSYIFEISPALKQIFNFETTQVSLGTFITHQIVWSPIFVDINGTEYLNATCRGSRQIYPFDLLLLCTNLPITPTTFLDNNSSFTNTVGEQLPVLFSLRNVNEQIGNQISIVDKNENMGERARTFYQETHGNNLMFNLILRSKSTGNFLEWILPQGERMEFTLNTYNLL